MKKMADQTPPPHGNSPRFFPFFYSFPIKNPFQNHSQESNNSGFSDSTVLGSFNALSTFTSLAGIIVEVHLVGQTTLYYFFIRPRSDHSLRMSITN